VQGTLQFVQLGPGVLECIVPSLLSIGNGCLQVRSLNKELEKLENWKESWASSALKSLLFFKMPGQSRPVHLIHTMLLL
jgi:hypothetical protein